MRSRTRVPCILAFAPLLILLAGCGRQGSFTVMVSPDRGPAATLDARTGAQAAPGQVQGNSGFFPLAIGNHWHYARTFSVVMAAPESIHIVPPVVTRSATDARLVRAVTLGEREYVVEEDVVTEDGVSYPLQPIYWRQDRTGLYEAELFGGDVAGDGARVAAALARAGFGSRVEDARTGAAWRAARQSLERKLALVVRLARGLRAGPVAGESSPDPTVATELTRLLYPLRPGASWDIRTDPLFTSRVEGKDVLRTAAGRFNGWRMRYDSELFGPNDVVHVWYGDDGYLGLEAHTEGVATDESGNPVGLVISDLSERIDGIDLVKRGSPGF